MSFKPIIIVAGEPNSIFLEILFKSIKKIKIKSPIILICSKKLFLLQMKALNANVKFNPITFKDILKKKTQKKIINLLDVNLKVNKAFGQISKKSNIYINDCFKIGLELIKKNISKKLINGPISKKHFLNGKHLGITEYLSKKTNSKKSVMLIYNKLLSVCPITTHLPVRNVSKSINKNDILQSIILINNFYKNTFKLKPKIAVTGLNPHCETTSKINEDDKIIKPTIQKLAKSGIKISGPYPADTIFIKKNRDKFNIIVGMYHDQVLTPMKTLFEYDAINITLGLPFTRISPDHGPNEKMIGKNLSNPLSLIKAISFLDKN